ncbi:hypothetical protein SAMN05920897_104158 [Alkalispirochaeta americana]|uniref:NlpC/P60 family protein n=1 Tax=Alkalispirochaeta americana TaxID=159291 RepID=A0A1N6QG75_9SPIO|nr:hypothetical protein [Alkalispirochaeta americana]SIQ15577.1 hypothetical protein SAMN05920897_104158 [Alkalispirochaeta americana]
MAEPPPPSDPAAQTTGPQEGPAIAEAARALVGRRSLRIRGRVFPSDCSGVILAIFYQAGIDLMPAFAGETGNGVKRLWKLGTPLEESDIAPGDIIFWDNTYDRNRNNLWDDELTHAGIVAAIDGEGTISYVHHNYRRGIVEEKMNLLRPQDTTVNSAMRMRGQRDPEGERWLSSHLFREARRLY